MAAGGVRWPSSDDSSRWSRRWSPWQRRPCPPWHWLKRWYQEPADVPALPAASLYTRHRIKADSASVGRGSWVNGSRVSRVGHGSVPVTFWPIVSYLSKAANFNLPHLHLAPPLGVTRLSFADTFGIRKLHRESKKGATLTMAITLSILDRFPKFFHYCREQ